MHRVARVRPQAAPGAFDLEWSRAHFRLRLSRVRAARLPGLRMLRSRSFVPGVARFSLQARAGAFGETCDVLSRVSTSRTPGLICCELCLRCGDGLALAHEDIVDLEACALRTHASDGFLFWGKPVAAHRPGRRRDRCRCRAHACHGFLRSPGARSAA